jgi:hypothetical protein
LSARERVRTGCPGVWSRRYPSYGDVGDLSSINHAFDHEQGAVEDPFAVFVYKFGNHGQVGRAGLVFERDEADAFDRTCPLSDKD